MAKGEALKGHLENLRSSIPELKGVLLASNEGLPIAHSLSNGSDPNRVAAMAAAASNLGRKISDSMSAGTLGEVSIQADEGSLFVYSAGSKAVLAVLSPQGGNAGLIHLEARSAAKEIGDLF
jgi:predicted regulator of Ras-like GTPase activity (Roadblock/LC7/MglB family)